MSRKTPIVCWTLVLFLAQPFCNAWAGEPGEDSSKKSVSFLGWAREIPRNLSASRDAPAFNLTVAPRTIRTAAGEFALVTVPLPTLTLRTGFMGLLELEGGDPNDGFDPLFPVARGGLFWRGSFGYYAAASFDALGRRMCDHCALEATLAFRHESEHVTASNEGDVGEDYGDRPIQGDMLTLDLAGRFASGRWSTVVRLQNEFFLPQRSSYSMGPALDVMLRLAAWKRCHFQFSGYSEVLFGTRASGRSYPDAYLLRGLLGVVLPSEVGDFWFFLSGDVGHRKGLNAYQEEATLGFGIRLSLGPWLRAEK